jgi:hypothetical protein
MLRGTVTGDATEHGLLLYTGNTEKFASRKFQFFGDLLPHEISSCTLLEFSLVLTDAMLVIPLTSSHDRHVGNNLGRKSK